MRKSVIPEERVSGIGLTREETTRYSRHLIMPEVTANGQRRLKAARVLCIGAGGLGSPAALYLAVLARLELSISMMSIFRICSGKFFTEQRTLAAANWNRREIGCATSIRISTSNYINADSPAKMHRKLSLNTTLSSMDRIISPRVICRTTCAFSKKSQMCTVRYSVSKDRRPCSRPIWAGHVIVVFFRSRLHQNQFRTARKQEYSASCRESSGYCRRSRRSNSLWASASP